MGRSRFPGKPSKHCNRKRVNVLPPSGELNQESDSSPVTVIGASKEDIQDEDRLENQGESRAESQKTRPLKRRLCRKVSTTIRKNGRSKNFIRKIRGKTNIKTNRASKTNLSRGPIHKETTNFGGKFVLPTRSVHSSRVIKPNKRFIDLNETLNIKQKTLTKRPIKVLEENNPSEPDSKDKLAFSNGHRVILRQARLKLPNQVGTQGPFSSNLNNGPGTIICGVCGAVRYYRFVKQARKFNIYSCELCRKFISKQIKRQSVASQTSNVLMCLMGQGSCYVPPAERSQHWKISKCAYRSRCPACWLKMCLKAYHLPSNLKQNLTQLLPKNMRSIDFSLNSLPPILWQKNIEGCLEAKERPIRLKSLPKAQQPAASSDVKRQKIDLKGPRVKHVCRSASIVLGQPIATFNVSDKKSNSDSQDCVKNDISLKNTSTNVGKVDSVNLTDEETMLISSGYCRNYSEKTVASRKERTRSLPAPNVTTTIDTSTVKKGILLDYSHELNLENRYKYGFSLITTKVMLTSAICYLCGSGGLENIVVCCICCEPFHTFCIEDSGIPVGPANDWMCIKCAPCLECKGFEKSKISCSKCLKIYHKECFGNRDDAANSKLVCKNCTKCQDCDSATVYNMCSFPANRPLCFSCFEKKRINMHCPICQHSFSENSAESKMLECSKCRKWVHADCEKLTSEQYDILKLLPVSADFTCSHCLSGSSVVLQRSIEYEMQKNFNQIFKLLAKNKYAKNVLKKLPIKNSLFRKYLLKNNLDIDNNNYNKDADKIYSFEENEMLQKEPSSSSSNVYTLLDIKNRLCEYKSVEKFNSDMLEALKLYDSEQLTIIYKNIFQNTFPWFSHTHRESETNQTPTVINAVDNVPLLRRARKCIALPGKDTDNRRCELCQNIGDKLSNQESRLLYCGHNLWVHANCAFWSSNVYEQIDNHLQNVIETIECSRNNSCSICNKPGASIQCHLCRSSSYHFMCARRANFYFTLLDKACFCPKHPPDKPQNTLKSDDDFELNKTLFVEQNAGKTFRAEPENVSCLIGSLCIRNLGKIEPLLSDGVDSIVPAGFMCARMYWSTKEPWKLVTYVISTTIKNPNHATVTVDKNFTIDYSLGKAYVEKVLKELNDWQRVYEKKQEESESDDEEEKNGTELLSPELTDTLLEDLPHDLLDGISVQDIFSNFSYEDMLNTDNSNTDSLTDSLKKVEEDDLATETPSGWIRTKSDPGTKPRVPPLSLMVSYKVDNAHSTVTKKRKVTPNNMLLLQVDGAFDDESSSECGSPIGADDVTSWGITEEPVTCEKCQCTYRTQASYKRHLDSCEVFCTSESDSENNPTDHELMLQRDDLVTSVASEPIEVALQVNEPSQSVLIQAFETFQSQVHHTSVVNVIPEAPAAPPTQPVAVQPTITIPEPAPISISVPLCSIAPQIVQPSIEFQQTQAQPMTLQSVQQVLVQRTQQPRRDPVVLQQIQPGPAPTFMPFVDALQTNQSVQYVQLAPQVQSQPQLLQIRSDGNVIGILPSIQPGTMIVQQPQSLVLDNSGTFGWTQQPQPQIYYGFETIVQNTVLQSQQFLPTPVPGILAANSSYSTTTQVFQTSKLEPVLDVSSNSFVLVNSTGQLEVPQQYAQEQQNATVVSSQPPTIIYSTPPSTAQKSITQQNCISLPTAPFVSDHHIPMNIVPPIRKQVTTSQGRPMSRVLPMPTNASRAVKKGTDATKIFPEIDDKFVICKDPVKLKNNNKKFDLLSDYAKPSKQQRKIDVRAVIKEDGLIYKEFEPPEKIRKLSVYEPLKEIEKVKAGLFENTIKPPNGVTDHPCLDKFKLNASDILEERIKAFENEQLHQLDTYKRRPKIEVVPPSHQKLNSELDKKEGTTNNNMPLHVHVHPVEFEAKSLTPIQKDLFEPLPEPKAVFVDAEKPLPTKAFDMPQLEDMIKIADPVQVHQTNKPSVFNVQSVTNNKEEPPTKAPFKMFNSKQEDLLCNNKNSKRDRDSGEAPSIVYTIENKEEGFKCSSASISDCWAKVVDAIQSARAAHNMPPLPVNGKQIKSVQITGLKSNSVKYLIEQLPGASRCIRYKPLFKFTPHPQDVSDVCSHGFGAVRCQPHKTKPLEPYDMFSWLSSKHRQPFSSMDSQAVYSRRVNNFPMAMKFRNLKLTSKHSVGVYRSKIHGKGLFCLRDIEPGEMVIEYAGEVIRSILTDKREKFYNSKGIGCYMFRVDDNFVVDATMKGNAARFINHSCDPNCYSKVVEIMGHKHIIIFALRRILSGEELTYDYKFPFEEDKIPCTCGARRCRKFLN